MDVVTENLTIIFQPYQKGFREKLSSYISFKEVLEVREEKHVIGLGLSIYEEAIKKSWINSSLATAENLE